MSKPVAATDPLCNAEFSGEESRRKGFFITARLLKINVIRAVAHN